jgi:hypothetical protein
MHVESILRSNSVCCEERTKHSWVTLECDKSRMQATVTTASDCNDFAAHAALLHGLRLLPDEVWACEVSSQQDIASTPKSHAMASRQAARNACAM